MNKKIWGNTIVKNEGRYVWFAIKSVIDHLDKILIYDTGSEDDTVSIIKQLQKNYPKKIVFQEVGSVDANGITRLRQKMLEETESDWLILVDGDEVWFEDSIRRTIDLIQKDEERLYALVHPVINLIGDIYHYQEESLGKYNLLDKKGHFNIRAINRKIKGLNIKNEYPLEGFYTYDNKLIQDYGAEKLEFIDAPLMHFSNLQRSSVSGGDKKTVKRAGKVKYEIGKEFDKNFKYPEVFYQEYPSFIMSPWKKMSGKYKLRAILETPLKKIKRKINR